MTEITENGKHEVSVDLCRNAAMKLDSFITDIHEIREDEALDSEHKLVFEQIAEMSGTMLAAIVNMVAEEMGEESLFEDHDLDEIDNYYKNG